MSKKNAIIMLTYNRRTYTEKTLRSFEKQLGKDSCFCFFIYDNGSTDDTPEYLKNYAGPLSLNVTFGTSNIGVAEALKYLLKEKCFDKNFDFIIKIDDDEILPDEWQNILKYWSDFEKNDAVFIGFKRKEIKEYFEGFKWIAGLPDNLSKVLNFGKYECYRSILAPGCQISKQVWWEKVFPYLNKYNFYYGAWDYTLFETVMNMGKFFGVVYNLETDHFQNNTDYPEFSEFKRLERKNFVEKRFQAEKEIKKEAFSTLIQLQQLQKANPDSLHIKTLLEKNWEIYKKLTLKEKINKND